MWSKDRDFFVSLRGCAPQPAKAPAMDPNPCNYICLVAATVARAEGGVRTPREYGVASRDTIVSRPVDAHPRRPQPHVSCAHASMPTRAFTVAVMLGQPSLGLVALACAHCCTTRRLCVLLPPLAPHLPSRPHLPACSLSHPLPTAPPSRVAWATWGAPSSPCSRRRTLFPRSRASQQIKR